MVNDQPSSSSASAPSRYLKVGDDLFINISGAVGTTTPIEGEVFVEQILAVVGLQVVDEPSISSGVSKEDQLLQAIGHNFHKLQALHRDRKEKVDSRIAAVDKAEVDF